LNNKKKMLLQYLKQNNDWVNARTLANYLSVSTRTVRKYIYELNSEISNSILIHSSNFGYRMNDELSTFYKEDLLNKKSFNTPSQRFFYILHRLIISSEGIDVFDLSEELYISIPTIEKDFQTCKNYISNYNISILRKKNIIKLIGTEEDKRKLMSSIYYRELKTNFHNLLNVNEFSGYNLSDFREQLLQIISQYNLDINEYTIGNILLHIVVSVKRIKDNRVLPSNYTFGKNEENSDVTLKVAELIKEHFSVTLEKAEVNYLNALIRSKTIIKTSSSMKNSLETYVDYSSIKLVENIIKKVYDYYFVNLNDSDFFYKFALHIRNMKERVSSGFSTRNPLTNSVKNSSPFIYDLSVFISNVIKEKEKIKLNEDEIAYIAFHVGSYLELNKNSDEAISCILIVPDYYNFHEGIQKKLEHHLGDKLKIEYIYTDLNNINEKIKYAQSDLVLTTIELNVNLSQQYMLISPFLIEEDINAINKKISNIKKNRETSHFKKQLIGLFDINLFEKNKYFNNKFDVIRYLGKKMVQQNIVSNDFIQDVINREQLSSTAFNNIVAVPHSMHMNAKNSSISILINDKPMFWGDHEGVQLISLIAMNKNKRKVYKDIYEDYIKVLAEPSNAKSLAKSENYDSFIEKLSQFIENIPD